MSYVCHRAVGDDAPATVNRDTIASMVATLLDQRFNRPAPAPPPPPPPAGPSSTWLWVGGAIAAYLLFGRDR